MANAPAPLRCIGGPWDGELVAPGNPYWQQLRVPVVDHATWEDLPPDAPPPTRDLTYRREALRTADGSLPCWISDDLTLRQALGRLLAHYHPPVEAPTCPSTP